MQYIQRELQLSPYRRGFHLITDDIIRAMPELASLHQGLLHVFIKHSSASLTVNENADPTVRGDFERFFSRAVPENEPYYQHNDEGPDDMPAHLKASLLGSSVTLPVTAGRLNLGIWQGIYLGEHRDRASSRTLVLTLHGS
ncbi:MAG: secondary thiamine-phosphate synthase enzyme YjbQ [Alkalimonas sp.]|nr:secondary thiamine-phosphate synthase enzyme YjbQ [Alkalimonas sp.]